MDGYLDQRYQVGDVFMCTDCGGSIITTTGGQHICPTPYERSRWGTNPGVRITTTDTYVGRPWKLPGYRAPYPPKSRKSS